MNKIKFSHNWGGKLNHDIFTTIRKYTPDKYDYYFHKLGAEFEIELNVNYLIEKIIGKAQLIDVEYVKFDELPRGLLHCDTGIINNQEMLGIFHKFGIEAETKIIILTFKRIE